MYGHYFVIRYVPDVVRDECVNIGVILKPPIGPVGIRWTTNLDRAAAIDPKIRDHYYFDAMQDHLNRYCLWYNNGDIPFTNVEAAFREPNGTLQITPARVTKIDGMEVTLDELMKVFVEPKQ